MKCINVLSGIKDFFVLFLSFRKNEALGEQPFT